MRWPGSSRYRRSLGHAAGCVRALGVRTMIIYEGPSVLDGEPIVAIATGLQRPSQNRKTGDMVQAWIMRADIAPVAAVRAGADGSVCGDCKHRGTSCYVNLGQAPQNIWHAYQRGSYSHAPDWAVFSGRSLRMSAYGDPAALPFDLVAGILDKAGTRTGYTHQWRREPRLAAYLMASVDTPAERIQARMLGFRTFRVRHGGDPHMAGELECLADSAGLTCESCRLCSGQARPGKRDITIQVHGARKGNF